jgi:hypothetical protein
MHQYGQGVPKDLGEAIRLYKLSADQGNASAQYSLGIMHQYGQGVPKDLGEAIRLYKLSADQGKVAAKKSLKFGVRGAMERKLRLRVFS